MVDVDLVGIIVASVACGILLCVLVVMGAIFCHRRLERQSQKKAAIKTPYTVDPSLQTGSIPNTALESAETISGYRPKILNSNEEGIPEPDYQEFNDRNSDAPNGHAKPLHDIEKEGNKKDTTNIIVQEETTHYVNSTRREQNDIAIVPTAAEPYRIDEPPSSQSKVTERNLEVHSILNGDTPFFSEGKDREQVQVIGSTENGNRNATREENTVVQIIPFDEVELPLVGTTKAETQIIASSSRTVHSKPTVETVNSRSRTIHYTTTVLDDEEEPVVQTSALESQAPPITASGDDIQSESIVHIGQSRATDVIASQFEREPIAQTVQPLTRVANFISSSQDDDRDQIVQTAKSQTRTTHIMSSTQDVEGEPIVQATQSQTNTYHYTSSVEDVDRETLSQTRTTNFISSTQDFGKDHTTPSQTLTTHFTLPAQDNEVEPTVETAQSKVRTTHYVISSSQDVEEEPVVQNIHSESRTTHFISSSEDAERDLIVPTSQSQTRTTHYVISSTEDDGREPTFEKTQSQSRTMHFTSSSLNSETDPIVSTTQSQISAAHFISSAQDFERDPIVQTSRYQTSSVYPPSSANDFQAYSQWHTTRLVEEKAKAEASRNIVVISSQTGPEGIRLSSMKRPDVTTEFESMQENGDSGSVVRTYTTRSNDGSVRTYTTRTNHTYVNGAYIPFEGERRTWRTRTYEEKTNSVDFEGEANPDVPDNSTVSDGGEMSNEATAGMVSMLVRDYSFTDGSRYTGSNQERLDSADEYTILDYVDPNPSSSNTERNLKNVMVQIGDENGSRLLKKKEDIDISAEKIPPVFTSTPRAPPEMTAYAQDYANRQRKEYEGSVQYLPENDLITPL